MLCFGLLFVWYVHRPDSRFATFLRNVPRASVPIGAVVNSIIITAGFLLFSHYGIFIDAAGIFIVVSAVMSSLIASAMVEIDKEKKALAEKAQKEKEQQAYQAGLEAGRQPLIRD